MLSQRLITSAVLLTAVLGLMWLDGTQSTEALRGLWLLPLLLFFALGTAWELATLLQQSGRPIDRLLALIGAGGVAVSACIPYLWPLTGATYPPDCPVGRLGWIVAGILTAVGAALILEMSRYDGKISGTTERIQAAIFVSVYVGAPFALFVAIRNLGSGVWGLIALITLIAATKTTDAGAYFFGKAFGRHKLIPRLSPKKTVEGAIGGVVTSIAVTYACVYGLFPRFVEVEIPAPWWGPLVLAVVCAISGMVGDLAESLLKRDTKTKDSGTWLPGLGGVWDVTDSLLASSLPGFLCLAAGFAGR
ncbi:MAG: phosphatidate cytidylyltransferase [Pirellulaceae bacterium]